MKTRFTRRDFLKLSVAGLGTAYLAACGRLVPPAPSTSTTSPALPTDIAPKFTPTQKPTLILTPTPDPYQTWSTNFANLTDFEGEEIQEWSGNGQLSIDTTNVHSGGKSIKDTGTVNDQHLLQSVFKIHGLIGRDTIGLADKTLNIEIYVPSGSPLSFLYIELDSGNNAITVRANIFAQNGRWYTYKADVNMDIALSSWQYFDWLHSPGISSTSDAINILNNVQIIKISGGNNPGLNEAGDSYFLIDSLGWMPSGNLPAYDPSVDSLRKYAEVRNLPVGAFIELNGSSDPQYLRSFIEEFDIGSTMAIDWPTSEPESDNFDSAVQVPADVLLENIAGKLGSPLIRYALQDIPDWLPAKSYMDAQTILKNYLGAQVSYHKGKTKIWYVFNELLKYDLGYVPYTGFGLKDRNQPSPQTWANNYSPFSNSESDVTQIEAAFSVAREVDPVALLFLNDGGVEEMGNPRNAMRADAYYQLALKLVSDGTPIDGVGLQAHFMIDKDGKVVYNGSNIPLVFNSTDGLAGVAKNVERFQALGLKVAFTEVDVSIWTADIDSTPVGQSNLAKRLQLQAEVYRSLMDISLTYSNVEAFIFQGWADQYSWVNSTLAGTTWCKGYGDLGIFDVNYQPKPAYAAILDTLKNEQ